MSLTVTLPFGGETLSSFDPSSSNVAESTANGTFNATWSTCCLNVPPGNTASSPVWTAAPTFWQHHLLNLQALPFDPCTNGFHLDWYSGATVVMRVLVSGETTWNFDFYTLQGGGGGSLIKVDTVTLVMFETGPQTFDIGLVAGAQGSLEVAVAGSRAFLANGLNHSSFSGVTQVVLRAFGDGFGGSAAAGWSQVIFDTINTIGRFLYHARLNSNSAFNFGWTGNVGNINEIPTSDATPLVAASTGLTSTFFQSGISLTGDNILGAIGAARCTTQGAGPTNLEIALRTAGANYNSAPIAEANTFQAAGHGFTSNPATGLAWTPTDIASLELGVTSN